MRTFLVRNPVATKIFPVAFATIPTGIHHDHFAAHLGGHLGPGGDTLLCWIAEVVIPGVPLDQRPVVALAFHEVGPDEASERDGTVVPFTGEVGHQRAGQGQPVDRGEQA